MASTSSLRSTSYLLRSTLNRSAPRACLASRPSSGTFSPQLPPFLALPSASPSRQLSTSPPSCLSPLTASSAAPAPAAGAGTNTISPEEIAHFSSLAAHWWDPTGEFIFLHRMNPCRIRFVRESLERIDEVEAEGEDGGAWLEGRSVLDVGCGGGIFAESLARLGATTLAIDASAANILTAQAHAAQDPVFDLVNAAIPTAAAASSSPSAGRHSLEYRHCAAEDLVKEGRQFDVVCSMEVIEHVEDPIGFLDCLALLTKPGGHILLSTISRTPLAQLLTITAAEDVLRYVTQGTHTYSKFIKPDELEAHFASRGWRGMERRGCVYDPLKGGWRLLGMGEYWGLGEHVNYFAGVRKPLA